MTNIGSADSVGDGVDNNCDGLDGVDLDQDRHASTQSGGTTVMTVLQPRISVPLIASAMGWIPTVT